MSLDYIVKLAIFFGIVFCVIKLDKLRQKQIDDIREEFKGVLSFVESLKFRVYDHERQLLNKEGVFVPEDTGIFIFNILWGMIDEETKSNLQEEYEKVCPSYIPLWKYVLYSYKFMPRIERKIEFRNIESLDDLLNSITDESRKALEKLKNKMKNINESENEIEDRLDKVSQINNVVEDKKNS